MAALLPGAHNSQNEIDFLIVFNKVEYPNDPETLPIIWCGAINYLL
jgi:hypothetical protein